jgi:hypothetical protein
MGRRYVTVMIFLVLSLAFIALLSCSKAKPPARTVTPQNPGANKRVMVLTFADNSGLGKGVGEQVTSHFVNLLSRSSHLTLQNPPADMKLPADISSPQYGIVPTPQLVKKAEALGLDALIIGLLDPVEGVTKRRGMWPFRSTHMVYEVSAMINVLHVKSRTVLLTKLEMETVTFAVDKPTDDKALAGQALTEALPAVLEPLAEAASKSLEKDLSQRFRYQK